MHAVNNEMASSLERDVREPQAAHTRETGTGKLRQGMPRGESVRDSR